MKSDPPDANSIANPYELLRRRGICELLKIDQRTLSRWIADDRFPQPDVKKGARFLRWRRSTIDAWLSRNAKDGAK